MTRRRLLAAALVPLAAACSPLATLNALSPRDRGATRVAEGLVYGPHDRHRLDLYAPVGEGPWPVLVFFYGGGWDSGARGLYAWAAHALAARGFVVAAPDYRLVPEAVFPGFVEDAARATVAAAAAAPAYGGDPGRLGVLGHSAGAHLAMMIALDPGYLAEADGAGLIRAAAGLAGPYEFLPLDVAASRNAFGHVEDLQTTQPIAYARAGAPPLWLGHGLEDETVHAEDSVLLGRAMEQAGGRAEVRLYPELNHVDLISTFSPFFRRKAPVLDEVAAFFRRELG